MPLKLKILGTDIVIGKRLFGLGKEDDNYSVVGQSPDRKQFDRLKAYRRYVYSCINLIAEQYGSYKPIFSKQNGTELKPMVYHEMMTLLNNPGGRDDKAIPISLFDLLHATSALIELQGGCYWYLPYGETTRKPREIILLRADKVGIDLNKETGDIDGFFVRTNGGADKIPLTIQEVIPFIGFDPEDPYRGVGTTEAAEDFIETDKNATLYTRNFFKNNAGISGILSLKGEVTKGAFKKFVRAWRDKYEGVDSAGKVMMVRESDAKFEKLGLGLQDLDMKALRTMSLEDIAIMFRVPLALLGKNEQTGLGRNNIEAFEYVFSKYTIEPKLKRLDAVLQFMLERYWGTTDIFISHENIVPADEVQELAERDKGVDRWITRDEIRAEEGLPNTPGGDQLRAPINSVPIGDTAQTSGSGSTQASFKSGGIKIKIKRKVSVEYTKKKDPKPTKDTQPNGPEQINSTNKENFRLRLMRNQTMYERHYKKKFTPILIDQRKEALYNLEAHASSIKKLTKAQQKLFDDAAYDTRMVEELMPTLISLGEDQGALALVFAGDSDHEFRMTANYESLLRASTHKMAKNFNDETLDKLNKTLAEGIQAGEALDKLKQRVDDVYDGAEDYRTLRVARTETLKASNAATTEAYRQTGYVKAKQWYVNPGSCPQCDEFNGKTIPLDDSFLETGQSYTYTDDNGNEQTVTNDYDTVEEPPLHPNCRCTIIPVR